MYNEADNLWNLVGFIGILGIACFSIFMIRVLFVGLIMYLGPRILFPPIKRYLRYVFKEWNLS